MKKSHCTLKHLLNWTVHTLEFISSVMLFIMMILTLVDVIGRYVFNSPVFGASEMITQLMAVVIFAGLGICNARDQHIIVELFDERIRAISPRAYSFFIQSLSIVAMSLIAYVLFEQVLESYHHNSRTIVLGIPMVIVITTIMVLSIISVFSLVAGLIVGNTSEDES